MTVIKTIRIDEELLTKAEKWAEYAGLSFNKLAEMAIKQSVFDQSYTDQGGIGMTFNMGQFEIEVNFKRDRMDIRRGAGHIHFSIKELKLLYKALRFIRGVIE